MPERARDLCGSVRARIDTELADFLDDRLRGPADDATAPLFRLVREFVLHSGKRLRPLLCYRGWRAAGGKDCAEIIKPAAALEIFHAFWSAHRQTTGQGGITRARLRHLPGLVDHWRKLPFRDPGLPRELLADDWNAPAAGALFERLVALVEGRALAHAAGYWTTSPHPAP